MKTTRTIDLPQTSPGTGRWLEVICYGTPNQRPKAYLQAGLHADEAPGYAVLNRLIKKLDEADARADITGEIVVVPAANPIGLAQWRDESLQGRFDFVNSINFNRQHHDLAARLIEAVKEELGSDSQANTQLIRKQSARILQEQQPENETEFLKTQLLRLSHDADIVLDLHCDLQALMHVYLGTALWPEAQDLSAQLGAEATLLAADSGGTPFDEANSRLWWVLREQFPDHPIACGCCAATVELRGSSDTDPQTIDSDAHNLYLFLQRRGLIEGEPPSLPPLINEATPLTGVDYVKAPAPGIIVFFRKPGEWIKKEEVFAEIINPLPGSREAAVVQVKSRTAGLMFSRAVDRFARPGRIIAKIAGEKPLVASEGNLLTL